MDQHETALIRWESEPTDLLLLIGKLVERPNRGRRRFQGRGVDLFSTSQIDQQLEQLRPPERMQTSNDLDAWSRMASGSDGFGGRNKD
jgi:hypothetical protein